jgi:CRP-like cAMP-binding protein
MIEQLIDKIKQDPAVWEKFGKMFVEREIPPKTILLYEGEIANQVHFIRKGCLRMWFNKDGKDITTQFFFEGQGVASIESFMTGQPSLFTLESIEPSIIWSLSRENFELLPQFVPGLKEGFQQLIFQRFRNYAQLFLSRIKDTPRERYEDLLTNHPEIIKRVPQHYIASYLGITPISLSRIRNRRPPLTPPKEGKMKTRRYED